MPKKYVFVVQSRPTPGMEAEYNEWYDKQHIPDVVALPGFVSAKRFKYKALPNSNPASHPYLALYTIETDDLAATQAALAAAVGTSKMVMSDAIDLTGVHATYYESLD